MADDADVSSTGERPSGVEPGASATWDFDGAEGLARLSGPYRFSAVRATGFRARLHRVQLDHVALNAFAISPHRAERGAAQIAEHSTPLLSFIHLAEGSFSVELDGSAFTMHAGQFIVVDSRDPIRYLATENVRLLMSTIGLEHVPPYLRERGMTIAGPLHRTALTDSFLAFASTTLRSAAAGRAARGAELIRATADLQCAVLAEAQNVVSEPTGAAGTRYRIEEHIEQHLMDDDLGPSSIAEALGISLRTAHSIFNNGDRSISRHIRDRRIARIALVLRTSADPVELSVVASRFGFPSLDAMSRAFRAQIGVSPTEYRSGGHRAFG